jgi:glycosyltransferase involved in cell wall biosynthesis
MAASEKPRQNLNMESSLFPDRPLVTVVIATYNRQGLVKEAIASVLVQTYPHWELIVADDGSCDDTVAVVRSLRDPRIHVLELPHTGIIATVRNAGVQAGTGTWVSFLDSDDVWLPHKLELQLDLLEREKRRWAYGGFELMNGRGETISNKAGMYSPISGWIIKPLLRCEASVNIGSLMVERALFDEIGGFDTEPLLNFREDYDLALRLAMKAEAAAASGLVMRVREHEGRVTSLVGGGNERSGYVYRHFMGFGPGKELGRIARRQLAFHLAESAVNSSRAGRHSRAIRQWWMALCNGDKGRHLFSSLRRMIHSEGNHFQDISH